MLNANYLLARLQRARRGRAPAGRLRPPLHARVRALGRADEARAAASGRSTSPSGCSTTASTRRRSTSRCWSTRRCWSSRPRPRRKRDARRVRRRDRGDPARGGRGPARSPATRPTRRPVRRLDEAGAAKRPVIRQPLLDVVIFSGIQPTGRKHLGNYIGAITQYVAGQDRGDPAIYCIVDLHATTVDYDPAELRERVYDTAAILLAAGLDPERCILFRQGDVHEHAELCWLLVGRHRGRRAQPHAPVPRQVGRPAPARLRRAALLPRAAGRRRARLPRRTRCRSGEDQREHLELMRDVAERFNARFGEAARGARAPHPRGRRAGARPPGARRARCRPPAAPSRARCYVLDEPDVDPSASSAAR